VTSVAFSNEWDPPTATVGLAHLYALNDPRETHEVRKSYSDWSSLPLGVRLAEPRLHPGSTRRRINQSLASELPRQARLQALAESRRHIKHTAIADQANNIASPIQNGNAVFAHTKMFFHSLAERGLYGLIDVVRQIPAKPQRN